MASAYAPSPVSAQSAKPGVLEEPRWAVGSPLRVYISGVVSEARDGLVATEIVSALREWRNASNGKIRFVLTERYVDADILFVCENTVEHQWAENITSYHNSMFDRVRVRLLEETLYKLAPRRVRAVCLHEVGHAFGIRAHSSNNRDAMSLAATDDLHPVLSLTSNDRKLLAKLYP
ncbi:MAG TPA: matrixin family metalloprotease [Drouetiella sp.]